MNFLNEEQGYFTYKYGLYSAGHAQLDLTKSLTQESMIQDRDRNKTLILGDSGGFQIGKGVLKFDWLDFEGKNANKTRQSILEWLECTADWSMMLDVPTWACDHNHTEKTGLKTFEDCLEKTKFNNEYFLKNRLGQTKFLNVLQGGDWERAEQWYNGVKEFSDPTVWGDKAAEGWAMGGANMSMMDVTLKRLMTMRDDGMLKGKNWMHFLGTAQLDWACFLTLIQRQIRKHINEEITISFDCASPFIATAHGLVYTNPQHSTKRWSTIMEKAPDSKALAGSKIPFPWDGEISSRITMGDLCWYKPGMLNKIGKEGKTSWDSFSYALLMGHNVWMHIESVQRANREYDAGRYPYMMRNENGDHKYFRDIVDSIFATTNRAEAEDIIEKYDRYWMDIIGTRGFKGKKAKSGRPMFNQLFETVDNSDDGSVQSKEDFSPDQLARLDQLESEQLNEPSRT
jgi:hypothetical protein